MFTKKKTLPHGSSYLFSVATKTPHPPPHTTTIPPPSPTASCSQTPTCFGITQLGGAAKVGALGRDRRYPSNRPIRTARRFRGKTTFCWCVFCCLFLRTSSSPRLVFDTISFDVSSAPERRKEKRSIGVGRCERATRDISGSYVRTSSSLHFPRPLDGLVQHIVHMVVRPRLPQPPPSLCPTNIGSNHTTTGVFFCLRPTPPTLLFLPPALNSAVSW